MEYKGVTIERPNQDTVVLSGQKVVVIDPFKVDDLPKADLLLITHHHPDHLSPDDIDKTVEKGRTVVVGPAIAADQLKQVGAERVEIVKPGDQRVVDGVNVRVVPAYNINKFREPDKPFHPREEGQVGYIVSMNGVNFYHTGDADLIDEMKALGPIDVLFVPVSGKYVMTVDEAVEAVKVLKPKLAIPMHFGAIVGDRSQAEEFQRRARDMCQVEIL